AWKRKCASGIVTDAASCPSMETEEAEEVRSIESNVVECIAVLFLQRRDEGCSSSTSSIKQSRQTRRPTRLPPNVSALDPGRLLPAPHQTRLNRQLRQLRLWVIPSPRPKNNGRKSP